MPITEFLQNYAKLNSVGCRQL